MKKKILICSIIAVVILILVSFTSVVGYSRVKSDSNIDSPLFRVRNNAGGVTGNYIGKEKETNLYFPKRNSETESFDKVINIIKRMDDKSFDRFVKIVIANINQNNRINDVEVNDEEISEMLSQLRDNSEEIKNNLMMIKDKELEFVSIQPIPFCILLWSFVIPLWFIIQLFFMIPLRIFCWIIPAFPTFY